MLYFIYSFKFMSSTFDHFNVKGHYLKWIIIIYWNFQNKCEIWGLINFHIAHWQQILLTFFFNFTKQHLRSAISYNYHWTLQSEFSFLLCQVINMKKWKYWAGFSCWLWVFFYRNNQTIIEVDGVIVWKLSGELMGGLWWKILINW